ncbi:MAG: hypothetical protein EXQ47_10080 [Bryobacterales bacterium]|nr:hypothetical protein [Bryobacterales bacterium]
MDFEFLGPERLDQGGNLDGVCDPDERCYVGEHNDTFEDAGGTQYVMGYMDTASPCSLGVLSLQLNKGPNLLTAVELGGGMKRLMTLFRCASGDVWTDFHFGCAKNRDMCVVSTTYGGSGFQRSATDLTPVRQTAHLAEILVIKDNGAEIRRLAKHRSMQLTGEEAKSYWSTPRACLSNDGKLVVADSNFGEANRPRVVVIETGY